MLKEIDTSLSIVKLDPFIDLYSAPNLDRWFEKHETIINYDRQSILKPTLWNQARERVKIRDDNECVYPDIHHSKRLQVHHLIPLHAGGEPYEIWGLALLCTFHHALMHPGLAEAYQEFSRGNKDAFKEFAHMEHLRKFYDPPAEAHVVRGIVIERMRNYHGTREVYKRQERRETPRGQGVRIAAFASI